MSDKPVSRRKFLKYIVGGAVVAVGAGAVGYLANNYTTPPPSNSTQQVVTATEVITNTQLKPIEFGVTMFGFHDEGAWDPNAYAQLITLKDNYKVDIHLYEEVGLTDINRILTLGAGTDDIIWAHSYSYADAVKAVAANFPTKYFLAEDYASRPDYFTPNVVAIGQTPHEAYFLCGALSAKMSASKKLGYVHNIEEPFSTSWANAYKQGAQYAEPSATVTRVVIGNFVDPVKTRDAVDAMTAAGVDAIFNTMDDFSAIDEAQAKGIYACQAYYDATYKAPDTVIANGVWNFSAILNKVAAAIVGNTWSSLRANSFYNPLSLKDGSLTLGTYGNKVTSDDQNYIEQLKQQIISGQVVVNTNETTWTS